MIKNRQAEMIKKLNPKEILLNLYLTQILFLVFAILLSYFFYKDVLYFTNFLMLTPFKILVFGGGTSIIVITLDLLMWRYLPQHLIDDGGINEKIFSSLSVFQIFIIALLVSFSEEILFRATLQPKIGLIWTSIGFAVMHVRYLNKIVLLGSALALSFFLGWIFEVTQNLYITIFSHFLIDFILGVILCIKPFAFLRDQKN